MAQMSAALEAGLDWYPSHYWVMVSVTMRHHAGMRLRWQRDLIFRAWRRCRQDGSVQRTFKSRVVASARAFEVTHARKNGWHPHLHVALLTTEWTEREQRILRDAFLRALVVEASTIKGTPYEVSKVSDDGVVKRTVRRGDAWDVEQFRTWSPYFTDYVDRALRWSEKTLTRANRSTALSAYMTDIGLEMTLGSTKATRVEGSRTPWQIAESAVDGDETSKGLWWEYENAVKGTRCIELDDRAAQLAKVPPKKQDLADVAALVVGECEGELSFAGAREVGEEACFAELDPEMLVIVRDYERFIDPHATLLWLKAAADTCGPLTAASIRESVDACIRGMVECLRRWRIERTRSVRSNDPLGYSRDAA